MDVKYKLESMLNGKEFDEECHLLSYLRDIGIEALSVEQTGWFEDGKYRFSSDLVIKVDSMYFKLKLSMFGNNPRDDYQYIEVECVSEVVRTAKTVWVWEEYK